MQLCLPTRLECLLTQVIFTGTPSTAELQQNLSLERLCAPTDWAAATTGELAKGPTEQGLGEASCRVCYPFQWGEHQETGRIQLSHFFRLVSQYHKADVPFYVFEADIGGCEHNKCSYGEVDDWSGRPTEAKEDVDIRHTVAQLYQIPSVFGRCHLVVSEWRHMAFSSSWLLQLPHALRPAAVDGVLLIGPRRSGSAPHGVS